MKYIFIKYFFKLFILLSSIFICLLKNDRAWGFGILSLAQTQNFSVIRSLMAGVSLKFYVVSGLLSPTAEEKSNIKQITHTALMQWGSILWKAGLIEKDQKYFEILEGHDAFKNEDGTYRDPLDNEIALFYIHPTSENNQNPYYVNMKSKLNPEALGSCNMWHRLISIQYLNNPEALYYKKLLLRTLHEIGHLFGMADNYLAPEKLKLVSNNFIKYLPGQPKQNMYSRIDYMRSNSIGIEEILALKMIKESIELNLKSLDTYYFLTFQGYKKIKYNELFCRLMEASDDCVFFVPEEYMINFNHSGLTKLQCIEEKVVELVHNNNIHLKINLDYTNKYPQLNGEINYSRFGQNFKSALNQAVLTFNGDSYSSEVEHLTFTEPITLQEKSIFNYALYNFKFESVDIYHKFWMVSFQLWEDGSTKHIMCQPMD